MTPVVIPELGDRLTIYLNDHLAGATAGLDLARRAASNNQGAPYGRVLAEVAEEIAQDREALEEVMARLSVGHDRVKVVGAWAVEKLGRLKLNGSLLSYSPLSRLEEIEGLSLGVEGKLSLWQSLKLTYGDDPRLRGVDLDALIDRARSQRRRLERQRRHAAHDALR
jgi:hypothetical protein